MLQLAFKPKSIKQLLVTVATKTSVFCRILEHLAETKQAFSMEMIAGRTLLELNARTVVGEPFHTQDGDRQIVEDLGLPSEVWHDKTKKWNLVEKARLRSLCTAALQRSSNELATIINKRYHELKAKDVKSVKNILDNCLIRRIETEQQGGLKLSCLAGRALQTIRFW